MSNDPYYGFKPETTTGKPLLDRSLNPALQMMVQRGPYRKPRPSLLSRLFRRKAKPPVIIRESKPTYVDVTLEYEGKVYQGVLYPMESGEEQ